MLFTSDTGKTPVVHAVQATDGKLYGTTYSLGPAGYGAVYVVDAGLAPPAPGEAAAGGEWRVTAYDKATGDVTVSYGPACQATDHHVVYGPLSSVATYALQRAGVQSRKLRHRDVPPRARALLGDRREHTALEDRTAAPRAARSVRKPRASPDATTRGTSRGSVRSGDSERVDLAGQGTDVEDAVGDRRRLLDRPVHGVRPERPAQMEQSLGNAKIVPYR